ncbi:hypothetical protein STENM327S_01608 [Streptomyces tendae]
MRTPTWRWPWPRRTRPRSPLRAAEEALQLHGGIGMTWEHPVHLYLKRAKADSIAYGAAGTHRAALAELVGLRAP